ncbi:uncharacterized protein VNE69_05021 [Vairimorpha necatrix]|uniref:C2H2-type domain-containing protein n=1 Tax=Vairimorpha necatrix TaxID=6039 RepID=A0AAX4JBP2_9MICR
MCFEKEKFLNEKNISDLKSSTDDKFEDSNLFSFYKKSKPVLTWKEERAINNLVVMSNIISKNLYSDLSCIPSCEFISDKLQCLDCDSPVDSYMVQMLIYCGVIGDFSILMKQENSFENEVISTFEKNVLDTYYKKTKRNKLEKRKRDGEDITVNEISGVRERNKIEYDCAFCKSKFTSKNGLNYHTNYVHSEEKQKVVKPFKCPVDDCHKKYKNKNGLYYHLTHRHKANAEDIERLYDDIRPENEEYEEKEAL